jgi:hypothetical protein
MFKGLARLKVAQMIFKCVYAKVNTKHTPKLNPKVSTKDQKGIPLSEVVVRKGSTAVVVWKW